MKLLVLFLAGVVTGACLSWLCMRATLRTYKTISALGLSKHEKSETPIARLAL